MILHLGVMNGEVDMVDRAWGHLHDMSVMIRYPGDSGEVYVHGFAYMHSDVFVLLCTTWGGCHMDVVIDCGEVDWVCGCVLNFYVFSVFLG